MVRLMRSSDPISLRNLDTILGFDYGIKKIGVAIGQRTTGVVNPLETVFARQQKTNWPRISYLIEEWNPSALVVGVSYQQDGTENLVTQPMLRFSRQLEGRYQLPVFLEDETLSTRESKRMLLEEACVKARKLKNIQDQVAAQLILQTWLLSSSSTNKMHD